MKDSYEPSPIEIWQQCSNIQATWTPEEEQKRRGAGEVRWLPPGCNRVLQLESSSRLKRR
jgi:hypothetical protein